jgi:DnaK suppressor protein
MAHSATQLDELHEALDFLIHQLQTTLEGSAEAARPVELDPPTVGRISRIDAIQQQKMVEANRQALRTRLQLARAALRRFEDQEYGDCRRCGESVSFERLKARPETPFCIECQTERERK